MLRSDHRRLKTLLAAALLAAAPLLAHAQQTDTTSRTISGRVVNTAGEPLPGAIVTVAPVGTITQAQSTTAASDGDFKVDNLETGLYRIWAGIPGYVANSPPSPEESFYHPGESVTITLARGGVVTGKVSGTDGPAVGISVRALRLRDADGKPASPFFRERSTDDRGVYRLYGLPSGTYVILAGGSSRFGGMLPTAFDGDSPTYFPSSTRDTASEIIVRSGEEVTADIQYRSEPGHAISGLVTGAPEPQPLVTIGVSIILTDPRDRATVAIAVTSTPAGYAFALLGVPDGEYELYASQNLPSRDILKSEPRRIKVDGADVSGLKLSLQRLAGIDGRLVLQTDPQLGCGKRRETASTETLITARRYEPETKPGSTAKTQPAATGSIGMNTSAEAVPDASGNFALRNLVTGTYRIDPRVPASGWYIRSITSGALPSAAARNAALALARDGVTLKSGERVTGLTVTVAEGAASVRGRVTVTEGQTLPSDLRVYLAPADKENAADVLRFFETRTEPDGTFTLANIAPGNYWLVSRPNSDPSNLKPIRHDPDLRLAILREAEKGKKELALKPCEKMKDYDLPYAAGPK